MSESLTPNAGQDQVIQAVDHLAPDESIVRSGIALADAVLHALEDRQKVAVSFKGIKGASSTYFNVFLRRIQEGYGLKALDEQIQLEFGSNVQRMIYDRSLQAIERGPRKPSVQETPSDQNTAELDTTHRSFWRWLHSLLGA